MLTQKQLDLLVFIKQSTLRNHITPSFDEMREALNLKSKSSIHRLINSLEERGYIRKLANKARAIEIIKTPISQKKQNIRTPSGIDRCGPEGPFIGHNLEKRAPILFCATSTPSALLIAPPP